METAVAAADTRQTVRPQAAQRLHAALCQWNHTLLLQDLQQQNTMVSVYLQVQVWQRQSKYVPAEK